MNPQVAPVSKLAAGLAGVALLLATPAFACAPTAGWTPTCGSWKSSCSSPSGGGSSGCSGGFDASEQASYSGEAWVLNFSDFHEPTTGQITIADTGALAAKGGLVTGSNGSYNYYNDVILSSAFSSVLGAFDTTIAGATVQNLTVCLQGQLTSHIYVLTADSVTSGSVVDAQGHATGTTFIRNLELDGKPVTVTGAANQSISFDVWTVYFNQQTVSSSNGTTLMETNGMHITMPDCLDGIVCCSEAGITVTQSTSSSGGMSGGCH